MNWTNDTVTDEEHRSTAEQIIVIIIMILIFFISIAGNACVCYIIVKDPKLKKISMITVFNLAVTDLGFTSTSIPISVIVLIQDKWPWDGVVCHLNGITMLVFGIASLMNLGVIAVSRYIAVCHSQFAKTYLTKKFYIGSVIFIWIISIAISFPPIVHWGSIEYSYAKAACTHYWPSSMSYTLFLITSAVFVPFIVIVTLYSLLFSTVRSNTKRIRDKSSSITITRSDIRLAKVSASIFFSFLICWSPISVTNFLELAGLKVRHQWNMFAMVMMYSNSICDPIIYSLMSNHFKAGFMKLLCCKNQSAETSD
ncbi:histamine H2 receptor [Patella vulgata]|uniref:histamine H2 receptor n=1 Tax=Patella vulgata TaxID=6465 RepID=UPI0021807938|nr:histamine H2 receptor [Patella vulgata]